MQHVINGRPTSCGRYTCGEPLAVHVPAKVPFVLSRKEGFGHIAGGWAWNRNVLKCQERLPRAHDFQELSSACEEHHHNTSSPSSRDQTSLTPTRSRGYASSVGMVNIDRSTIHYHEGRAVGTTNRKPERLISCVSTQRASTMCCCTAWSNMPSGFFFKGKVRKGEGHSSPCQRHRRRAV